MGLGAGHGIRRGGRGLSALVLRAECANPRRSGRPDQRRLAGVGKLTDSQEMTSGHCSPEASATPPRRPSRASESRLSIGLLMAHGAQLLVARSRRSVVSRPGYSGSLAFRLGHRRHVVGSDGLGGAHAESAHRSGHAGFGCNHGCRGDAGGHRRHSALSGKPVLLIIAVMAISSGSALWLVRVAGWRRDDAVLASVPGALSTVMAVAADRNASVGPIAIVQNLRLFALIALLPSVIVMSGSGSQAGGLIGQGLPVVSPWSMAIILLGGLVVGTLLGRVQVAAPVLLGATLVSTLDMRRKSAPASFRPSSRQAALC